MIKKGKTNSYKNKTSFSMIPLVHKPKAYFGQEAGVNIIQLQCNQVGLCQRMVEESWNISNSTARRASSSVIFVSGKS